MADDATGPACRRCRFFATWGGEAGEGECRRLPPTPLPADRGAVEAGSGIWPIVGGWEWCGEFRERPAELSAAELDEIRRKFREAALRCLDRMRLEI